MLKEAKIIQALQNDFPIYIGDDAAVISKTKQNKYLISKDMLIEDIHFKCAYISPKHLAQKVLESNLSDLAAMGAKPEFILMGIAIPVLSEKYTLAFLKAFATLAKKANVILIGGDTTKSPDKIFISITVIGSASKSKIKYRHKGKAGDIICLAGHLGYAHLGLIAYEKTIDGFKKYKKAFSQPKAKIREGLWLASHQSVNAMMDTSDGLFIDLKRLSAASKVKAHIVLDHLSPDPHFQKSSKALGLSPIKTMLSGGEDYGLLFTVNQKAFSDLATRFKAQFGYSLKKIGYLSKGKGIVCLEAGKEKDLNIIPFSHFDELL